MEVVNTKRGKNARKRKRHARNKRRERDQAKLEVRWAKRRKVVSDKNASISKEKFVNSTMEANAFWENYTAAQEWQRRHSTIWWKSRCFALENENRILRERMRHLWHNAQWHDSTTSGAQNSNSNAIPRDAAKADTIDEEYGGDGEYVDEGNVDDENLEFHVDEEMMNFLEQSMKHKMELKMKRESELTAAKPEEERIEGGAAWVREKTEGAKLLYGEAGPRMLAMETALQATTDRHKDRAKPRYWPNIPLNWKNYPDEVPEADSSNKDVCV